MPNNATKSFPAHIQAGPGVPSQSGRQASQRKDETKIIPPSISGRLPAVERKKRDSVVLDRQALGLSAMKPSQMVAGLDEVARRVEKIEAREESRRKSGGKMNTNIALHVDDTGRKWSRYVRTAIISGVAALVLAGLIMVYIANRKEMPIKEGNERTRRAVMDLEILARQMGPFDADETITPEKARARLLSTIEEEWKKLNDEIVAAMGKNSLRPPSGHSLEMRESLLKLKEFKDAWGQPFEWKMLDNDTLEITAKGKPVRNADPVARVAFLVRAVTQKPK